MEIKEDLFYTPTHEWAKKQGTNIRVGITDHAQHEISDIVHVELPEIDSKVKKGAACAVVESVKAAFDIYAPVTGTITKINQDLLQAPEKANQDPYGGGWFFEIRPDNPDAELKVLMKADAYKKFLSEAKPA